MAMLEPLFRRSVKQAARPNARHSPVGLTASTGFGHSSSTCCETLPEQQLADRIAMPEADHQQLGLVAFHRLQQCVGGVDPDGLDSSNDTPQSARRASTSCTSAGLANAAIHVRVARRSS